MYSAGSSGVARQVGPEGKRQGDESRRERSGGGFCGKERARQGQELAEQV